MVRVHPVLRQIVVAGFLCLFTGMTVAPAILMVAGAESIECTCGHGHHAICPMHKPRTAAPNCVIDVASDGLVNALLSIVSLPGLVVSSAGVAIPESTRASGQLDHWPLLSRSVLPDPRPPRL